MAKVKQVIIIAQNIEVKVQCLEKDKNINA